MVVDIDLFRAIEKGTVLTIDSSEHFEGASITNDDEITGYGVIGISLKSAIFEIEF